jgi:tetratricopeptide (TPR) repeat protein
MLANGTYTSLDAARRLQVLGYWDHAAALLDGEQSAEALELKAEILYERFLFQVDGIEAATDAIAALDPESPHARLLTARLAYARLTFQLDPLPDDYETAEAGYRFAAADPETHGWAEFHWGALLDNVREDGDAAKAHYTKALQAAHREGDLILESIVLRHLAWRVIEGGDREEGVRMLRRSLHLRSAAGLRPQVAAAQLLLAAELPEGDPERATLVEAARSAADELGLSWVRTGLEELAAIR